MLRCISLLVVQNRHAAVVAGCPLLGAKQTSSNRPPMCLLTQPGQSFRSRPVASRDRAADIDGLLLRTPRPPAAWSVRLVAGRADDEAKLICVENGSSFR